MSVQRVEFKRHKGRESGGCQWAEPYEIGGVCLDTTVMLSWSCWKSRRQGRTMRDTMNDLKRGRYKQTEWSAWHFRGQTEKTFTVARAEVLYRRASV